MTTPGNDPSPKVIKSESSLTEEIREVRSELRKTMMFVATDKSQDKASPEFLTAQRQSQRLLNSINDILNLDKQGKDKKTILRNLNNESNEATRNGLWPPSGFTVGENTTIYGYDQHTENFINPMQTRLPSSPLTLLREVTIYMKSSPQSKEEPSLENARPAQEDISKVGSMINYFVGQIERTNTFTDLKKLYSEFIAFYETLLPRRITLKVQEKLSKIDIVFASRSILLANSRDELLSLNIPNLDLKSRDLNTLLGSTYKVLLNQESVATTEGRRDEAKNIAHLLRNYWFKLFAVCTDTNDFYLDSEIGKLVYGFFVSENVFYIATGNKQVVQDQIFSSAKTIHFPKQSSESISKNEATQEIINAFLERKLQLIGYEAYISIFLVPKIERALENPKTIFSALDYLNEVALAIKSHGQSNYDFFHKYGKLVLNVYAKCFANNPGGKDRIMGSFIGHLGISKMSVIINFFQRDFKRETFSDDISYHSFVKGYCLGMVQVADSKEEVEEVYVFMQNNLKNLFEDGNTVALDQTEILIIEGFNDKLAKYS